MDWVARILAPSALHRDLDAIFVAISIQGSPLKVPKELKKVHAYMHFQIPQSYVVLDNPISQQNNSVTTAY